MLWWSLCRPDSTRVHTRAYRSARNLSPQFFESAVDRLELIERELIRAAE